MKRFVAIISVMLGIVIFSSGCEWLGRMTVKVEKGIEKGVRKAEKGIEKMENDFEKGQKDGQKDD